MPTVAPPEAAAATDATGPALRRLEDLPGPKGWPVLGSLLQIESAHFHLQLGQWARAHGRCYKLRMANRLLLVCADHEAVAAVLRDRPEGFRRTDRLEAIGVEMGLKPGLFGSNGEAWNRQRRMVMAAFDPGHVKA
jgi:cytochrome P450